MTVGAGQSGKSGDFMDHSAARRAMIDSQLRPEAVTDAAVLATIG